MEVGGCNLDYGVCLGQTCIFCNSLATHSYTGLTQDQKGPASNCFPKGPCATSERSAKQLQHTISKLIWNSGIRQLLVDCDPFCQASLILVLGSKGLECLGCEVRLEHLRWQALFALPSNAGNLDPICSFEDHNSRSSVLGPRPPDRKTYIRTFHTHIHTYIHTCIHAYMHTCKHAYMHAYINAYIDAHIHAYIHTCRTAWIGT